MKRKTLLSMLLIAAVFTAVIGGTYALFTDTEAVHVKFEAGYVDVEVNVGDGYIEGYQEISAADFWEWNDFKPGDEWIHPIIIHNNGSNRAWIQVYLYPTGPWTSDIDLRACDPNPDCNLQTWAEGPTGVDWNRWWIDPSQTLTLNLHALFPQCMGNNCMGGQADLLILIVAKQYRNKFEEGYSCVALEDKSEATGWLPDLNNDLEGEICYRVTGSNLEVDVNAYGLEPNSCFQLDLTGLDSNNSLDPGCTAQDAALANMPGDLYISGYWNWDTQPNLNSACHDTQGGEGVWNYAGVYEVDQVCSDDSGAISYGGTLTGLPPMSYILAAHVKEITEPWPGSAWTEKLAEMDYLRFTIP